MSRHITIIQGHPDPKGNHFGHALAAAYGRSAEDAGHEILFCDYLCSSVENSLHRSCLPRFSS
jgi:putative NADPH-quinone reductase